MLHGVTINFTTRLARMKLCKKIKIEVSERDAATLEWMQGKCRSLYNWWVLSLREGKRWPGTTAAKKTLAQSRVHDPELAGVYNKLLQEVFFRLDRAMQGFFRRVAGGDPPGFPRVRPRHQFFTLVYPGSYLKTEGNIIELPTGGKGRTKKLPNVKARLCEVPPDGFGDVAVTRDAHGNYFCSFVYDDAGPQSARWKRKKPKHKKAPAMRRDDGIVAFDLGIKELATGYTDQSRFYHIGGFKGYRYYNKQLDKLRSKRDKCKKKSRRYIRLGRKYKLISEKKRCKQHDCLHKASHLIAYRLAESAVVVGDLSQRQMVVKQKEQENLAERRKRHIRNRLVYNDWGLYRFLKMLAYKCERYGKELHIIDESYTSQMCHCCKGLQPMPLWKRTYSCRNCGMVMDRDENSAINIYERFIARLAPHTNA
jgi:putative transposase